MLPPLMFPRLLYLIPQVTKVALALRRRGLPVDTAVYTVEALRDALLRKEGGADAC